MIAFRPIIAMVCLAPLSLLAQSQTYAIDPIHSFPNFRINHLGMASMMGRFEKISGKIILNQSAKTGSLEVKIPTSTVSTGDSKRDGVRTRDEHLRGADFFNSAEFPDLIYKSTRLIFNGEVLESVEGNLTMLGVSKPVKLDIKSFKCGPHPFTKKPMCGADAEATLKRSDFGMKFGIPAIADEVRLYIGVEAYPE